MEEYLAAKKVLDKFKEEIDIKEGGLEKEKSIFPMVNLLYNLINGNKITDMLFEFMQERIEHKQKNIDKLKEMYNKYKNKLEEIENEL